MSNISHNANQKSCNFYTRTKFGIGFSFYMNAFQLPNLVYLHLLSTVSSVGTKPLVMSQFNTNRHNTQCGGSHQEDRIRRTGFGRENNDSPCKRCSFLDFNPLSLSEVVNHIASFHVWKFFSRPWILLKVALYDLIYRGMTVRPQCILPYRRSCRSRQCLYNSQSRHKHGFY